MSLKETFTRKLTTVEIAGEELEIQKLSIGDKDAIRQLMADNKPKLAQARIVTGGCPQFKALGEKFITEEADPDLMDELMKAINVHSGLTDKEAEKNLEAIQD